MARPDEDGFATPAAAVISAAISLVVAAVMARGLVDLRLAKADLARTQLEYALDAAQNTAMLAIATSSQAPPYHWSVASQGEAFDVVAEPERAKLSPQALSRLEDPMLSALGVGDPAALRTALGAIAPGPTLVWIADQAPSSLWRSCAGAFVSEFGVNDVLAAPDYGAPISGRQPGFWRAGEVWRVSVTNPGGWRDERILRFSGNGLDPAAILGRRLSHGLKGTQTCQNLIDAALAVAAETTATR